MAETVRPAISTDADAIRTHLLDFFADVRARFGDAAPLPDISLEKIRLRMAAPHIITIIEPGVGYCEVKVKEQESEVKVESLFPRGTDRRLLKPILDAALAEALLRYPHPRWRVWASFFYAVNAQGEADLGESECRAWQPLFAGSTVRFDDTIGTWVIASTLGAVTGGR